MLETSDGVTIFPSQVEDLPLIGYVHNAWDIHGYITAEYFLFGGTGDREFNGIYYDITYLIPELINSCSTNEHEHLFPLFKDILWELAQGKRIIYSGDF